MRTIENNRKKEIPEEIVAVVFVAVDGTSDWKEEEKEEGGEHKGGRDRRTAKSRRRHRLSGPLL